MSHGNWNINGHKGFICHICRVYLDKRACVCIENYRRKFYYESKFSAHHIFLISLITIDIKKNYTPLGAKNFPRGPTFLSNRRRWPVSHRMFAEKTLNYSFFLHRRLSVYLLTSTLPRLSPQNNIARAKRNPRFGSRVKNKKNDNGIYCSYINVFIVPRDKRLLFAPITYPARERTCAYKVAMNGKIENEGERERR